MSIPTINTNNSISSLQRSDVSQACSSIQDSGGGDNDASHISQTSGSGGKVASAIGQALAQLGVSPATTSGTSNAASTSDTSSTVDPQQALAAFMQNLFAALQPQTSQPATATNGSAVSTTNGNDGASAIASGSGTGTGHRHHHGGGISKLEDDLQSLIQQLSSASDQGASGSSSSRPNSSSSADDALQQSFNNLLASNGGSGSSATLSNFLQSLSQNLQGTPAIGNVVSTKA